MSDELDRAVEHVRLLVPKFLDIISNGMERRGISSKKLAPKFTLTPKMLSKHAKIWEEMGEKFAKEACVELMLQRDELNMNLITRIECHLQRTDLPRSALATAIERLVRSDLMPLISRRKHEPSKDSALPSRDSGPVLLDPAALRRYASPVAQTVWVRIRDAPRLAGHKGKNLRRLEPNPACSFRIQRDDEGLNTILQINANAPESLDQILWSDVLKRHAVTDGNISLRRSSTTGFENHRLRFRHDATQISAIVFGN